MIENHWKYWPPVRGNYFPITVWLQSPENAARFKAAGINLYVGLWQGPTEKQLATLKAAGMPVICDQNAVGLAHRDDPIIAAWMQNDEPDNAQEVIDPKTGQKGWGPCVPPKEVVARYQKMRTTDPSRPILLNLGQGVANDNWIGRGSGAKLDDYRTYVQGGDIISYDVYPIASGLPIRLVPKGVDRLKEWTGGKKILWNCIECTGISGSKKASPQQVRAEVWMSILHGSRGLIYFVHQFQPTFNEYALLDDPPMLAEVTRTNRQIQELAPILNSTTALDSITTDSAGPMDLMAKRDKDAIYLFAVGSPGPLGTVTFTGRDIPRTGTAEVLGESRQIPLRNGQFKDAFQADDVHLYRITPEK